MNKKQIINVTKSYLPPIEEYSKYLEQIWSKGWITNHGPLVTGLEKKLKKYLGVKHLFFVSNGTVALEIAIKALNLTGEIITTPFSYVATTSCIVWINCTPVFADIDPDTLCLDTSEISKAITKRTRAILATHVYGNPCDVDAIKKIAKKNKLKVIYDAAHCFGVNYKNRSVLNYGDISTLSFHATKLFHTTEGGAVITNDDNLAHKISYLRNFGHHGYEKFWGLGINGKNSEFHAAMGLCILPKIKQIIRRRKFLSNLYDGLLLNNQEKIRVPLKNKDCDYNYSYYPVIFKNEKSLLKIRENLNKNNIFPRRYFYPALSRLNYVKKFNVPISEDISKKVLCLPLFHDLKEDEVIKISTLIKEAL